MCHSLLQGRRNRKILTGNCTTCVGNVFWSSFHVNDISTYFQDSEGSQRIIEIIQTERERKFLSSVLGFTHTCHWPYLSSGFHITTNKTSHIRGMKVLQIYKIRWLDWSVYIYYIKWHKTELDYCFLSHPLFKNHIGLPHLELRIDDLQFQQIPEYKSQFQYSTIEQIHPDPIKIVRALNPQSK